MTLAIIQARLGSTRLPLKALMEIAGQEMIDRVLDRVLAITKVDQVVLAVPAGDGALHVWAAEVTGVDPNDVLGRFAKVAADYPEADPIVRVSGDCPLLDPAIADAVIDLYRQTPHCEYAWNVAPGYVDGTDVEVFSRAALLWAHRSATTIEDREHVTPWIRRHCKTATLLPTFDAQGLKTSVDTLEDLERVRALCQRD